jgi:hypothetical protein
MQGRSWMAALTVAAELSLILVIAGSPSRAAAGDTKMRETPKPAATHNVKLLLRIAGLSRDGCNVEIKPAHPGCSFRTRSTHVDEKGLAEIAFEDVKSQSADRDCTFAITIREAGQPERTVMRGLRLGSGQTAEPRSLECFLSSPSRLARTNEKAAPKR